MISRMDFSEVDRWESEQLFEEDVRAVLRMARPNRRERLAGWTEYRTGGADFRATISWDPKLEPERHGFEVPRLADVLEAILIGSAKDQDALQPAEEFGMYRSVLKEVYQRMVELESRYD